VTGGIDPKNLTAQMQYRAAGNPPSSRPDAAISNSYPGLEMDLRNIWTRLFEGIELHEGSNFVVAVDADAPPEVKMLAEGYLLISAGPQAITVEVTGPEVPGGPDVPLSHDGQTRTPLEWSNVLASIVRDYTGKPVDCVFQSIDGTRNVTVPLVVRSLFDAIEVAGEPIERPVIARDLVPPGLLTQSLCAPWQYDYRYCACFYWAATRPDYVNVQPTADGTSTGNNWLERNRTPHSQRVYIVDEFTNPLLVSIPELIVGWERLLRFVVSGIDEPPIAPPPPTVPPLPDDKR
jgi:hypothetical protein